MRTDAPLETFRLVLNDALGIAPSNLFFRDTNIIIQDIGTYVSPTGNKECIVVCRDEGVGRTPGIAVFLLRRLHITVFAFRHMEMVAHSCIHVVWSIFKVKSMCPNTSWML